MSQGESVADTVALCALVARLRAEHSHGLSDDAADAIESLWRELSEQARLLGAGSEREARLMARIAELERELAQAKDEIAAIKRTRAQEAQYDHMCYELAQAKERIAEMERKLKNYEPTDLYNGLTIEQWKSRAKAAERRAFEPHSALRKIVDLQAADDGLWFEARTASEAYLQQELRKLHAAIEAEPAKPESEPKDVRFPRTPDRQPSDWLIEKSFIFKVLEAHEAVPEHYDITPEEIEEILMAVEKVCSSAPSTKNLEQS